MLNINSITDKLISQGYPVKAAAVAASELVKVAPCLKTLVEGWLEGKNIDHESHGYSISGLMESRHMTYPAALLTIDWLIKDPDKAKKSLDKGIR